MVTFWLGTGRPPSRLWMHVRLTALVVLLLNVTVIAYFFSPPPAHWQTATAVTATVLPDAANAGAATPTATRGTLHAAPRATERRETCGADMRELQGGVGGGDVGKRH